MSSKEVQTLVGFNKDIKRFSFVPCIDPMTGGSGTVYRQLVPGWFGLQEIGSRPDQCRVHGARELILEGDSILVYFYKREDPGVIHSRPGFITGVYMSFDKNKKGRKVRFAWKVKA